MKKLILIMVVLLQSNFSFSQENNLVVFFRDAITDSIPIYSSETSTDYIAKIKEDPEKENWHDVEILKVSDNRYKVHIMPLNVANVVPIDGWVDKEQCGVWLRAWHQEGELFIVRLYSEPGKPFPFLKLFDKMPDDFGKYTNEEAAPVLDYKYYKGDYWIKTVIIKDKHKVIGWTRDFCPNVYDSCN
jgi:hypothetical protein